jgi:hypothetical protein
MAAERLWRSDLVAVDDGLGEVGDGC